MWHFTRCHAFSKLHHFKCTLMTTFHSKMLLKNSCAFFERTKKQQQQRQENPNVPMQICSICWIKSMQIKKDIKSKAECVTECVRDFKSQPRKVVNEFLLLWYQLSQLTVLKFVWSILCAVRTNCLHLTARMHFERERKKENKLQSTHVLCVWEIYLCDIHPLWMFHTYGS